MKGRSLFVVLLGGVIGCSLLVAAFPGRDAGRPAPLNQGEVWVARYDGAAHGDDYAEAIGVDSAGNVYVTGGSIVGYNNWDYATIKYSSAGVKKWARLYGYNTAGTAAKIDYARALVLDSAGNVYVTGESADEHGWPRFATLKYTPAGIRAWAARSVIGSGSVTCRAGALAVDAAGNAYVTGYRFLHDSSVCTKKDIATAKITAAGSTAWTRAYDDPLHGDDEGVAIGVDGAKNAYVAGNETAGSHRNFRMIKYSTTGTKLWSKYLNTPGDSQNGAAALKIVRRGSLMVPITEVAVVGYSKVAATGYDGVTRVLKTDGTIRWTQIFTGQGLSVNVRAKAVAADSAGNVYVAASGDCGGFFTLKYDVSGNLVWLKSYSGGLGADLPTAIAVDSAKNVYVTGQSQIGCNSYDYITLKYDAAGNHIWERRYDGTAHGYDRPKAITVDNAGYVYVTGYSAGVWSSADYVTIKYTAD